MSGGDWLCGSCQYVNFKKRDLCQRCSNPKYGGGTDASSCPYGLQAQRPEALAGDWYCSGGNCGAHNYASRTSCYRCGSTKDDYYGGYGGEMVASGGFGPDSSLRPGWKAGDWICTR